MLLSTGFRHSSENKTELLFILEVSFIIIPLLYVAEGL